MQDLRVSKLWITRKKNYCPLFNSVLFPGRFGYLDTLHFFNKVILIQLKIAYIRS